MKKVVVILALLIAAVCASGPASAQYESTNRSSFGIRYSFFEPMGHVLKSEVGGGWSAPGFDYYMKHDSLDRPVITISVNFMGKSDDYDKANRNSVTASYQYYFNKTSEKSWYVGGGLGLYQLEMESYGGYYVGWIKNGTITYGAHAMAGYNFGNGMFAELRGEYVDMLKHDYWGDVNFSGCGLYIGTRVNL